MNFKRLYRCVGEALSRFEMISDGSRILVALSGGKDSTILLHALLHFQHVAPIKFQLVGATFDPQYDTFSPSAVSDYCRALGVEHHTIPFPVDDIVRQGGEKKVPCVICSRMRRGLLYSKARELGCDTLALGHHSGDIMVSFLMSVCRGHGISTMGACVRPREDIGLRVIRPLAMTSEDLIRKCADEIKLPAAGKCPYEEGRLKCGDRRYFQDIIDRIRNRIPDVEQNMLKSFGKVETSHLLLSSSDDID